MSDRVFLGRYQTVRLLDEGGMSRVFVARCLDRDQEVVVKVMRDHLQKDDKALKHFQREIHVLSQIQHPNAVAYIDASMDDPNGPCLVMEYVRGVGLDAVMAQERRISPQRIGRFLEQLCDLLSAIHSQGIIHRDLKPNNILVVHAGTPHESLKVMDFGLAKLSTALYIAPEEVAGRGRLLTLSGTPQYMCPEQVRGDDVDQRGDLYSVGMMLFEMLSGFRPFAQGTVKEMLAAHELEVPPTFAKLGAAQGIPPKVEAVVRSCLAKSPAARPQSAAELSQQFQEALGQKPKPPALPQGPRAATGPSPRTLQPAMSRAPLSREMVDPGEMVFDLEVCMLESMAMIKLRGFFHDLKGEIVESVPGLIRVQVIVGGQADKQAEAGPLSWFGGSKSTATSQGNLTEIRLHMKKKPDGPPNCLSLKLVMRQRGPKDINRARWQSRCTQIYREMQAYLVANR